MISVRDPSEHQDWRFIENRKILGTDAVSSRELESNDSHGSSQASKEDKSCTNPVEQ